MWRRPRYNLRMLNPAENFAGRIVERLQHAGHTAYFAGGCVRDQIMGRPPKDYDVATSATPAQVLTLFPRGQQVGAAFGVILLVDKHNGQRLQVEVATFRADGDYSDGRHPDSVRFTTAQEDAQRRDFTCNGLFLDPLANGGTGQIHDFVGGQADIAAHCLRAIGDPAARFREDHLRMLRAVRFAARLGFTIEPTTLDAIREFSGDIQKISKERIGEELRLILEHPTRALAADMLLQTGLIEEIWPDIRARDQNPWHTLSALTDPVSRPLGLAAMQVDFLQGQVDLPWRNTWPLWADALRDQFVLSNQERDEFAWIGQTAETLRLDASTLSRALLKRLMADPRWSIAHQLFEAWSRDPKEIATLHRREKQMHSEGVAPAPFITGETLIALGATPGPNFKRWLEALYDRQLEGELSTPAQAQTAARDLIAS
jgi:poly(A) polymerase